MAKPYLCPVCLGRGTVGEGFYQQGDVASSSAICRETCRTCQGSGVLWDYTDCQPAPGLWIGPVTCNDIQKTIPPQGTVVTTDLGGAK